MDILAFQELRSLKTEDSFIKSIILSNKYNRKFKKKILKEYQVYHCEIPLTRWDIFEEVIISYSYCHANLFSFLSLIIF